MSKDEPCNMIFLKEKTFKYKKYFHKSPLHFKVYCNAERRCEHTKGNKGANRRDLYHQKPVSFDYYKYSAIDHNLPSGCHPYFKEYCKESLVREIRW